MKYALLTAIAILTMTSIVLQPVVFPVQAEDNCPINTWIVKRLPSIGVVCITNYDQYIDHLYQVDEYAQEDHR